MRTEVIDSIFVMAHEKIKKIPKDRVITYARIVVEYRPPKEYPKRLRLTAGGNLIQYHGELTTGTEDLTSSKLLWNSVLSTDCAEYMCVDIKNFYPVTPLDWYEYMWGPLALFP